MIFLVLFLVCESADRIRLSSVTIHPRALVNTTGAVGFHCVWVGHLLDQPCSYEQFKTDASRLDMFKDAVILSDAVGSVLLPLIFFIVTRPLV